MVNSDRSGCPSTGSPARKPSLGVQSFNASQNPSLSPFSKRTTHVLHPSVVLYNRLFSPGPEAITIAVIASQACTPRKSSVAPSLAASGVEHCVQCAPPSRVLSTVPPVPLAQATVPSTEKIPRRPAVVPERCICQTAVAAGGLDWPKARAEAAKSSVSGRARMGGSIGPFPVPCEWDIELRGFPSISYFLIPDP